MCFSIGHNNVSDLQMQLVSPSGKVVFLFDGIGWDGDNFSNTCLGGQSSPLIFNEGAPFSGTYRPMQSLGHQNNGQSANGTWKLRIRDKQAPTAGQLLNWSLQFTNQPVRIFNFSSSNLPVVMVDTRSQVIPDEPKISAAIKFINQSNGNRNRLADSSQFQWLPIGLEQRGSSSSTFPKKSYGFEFRDALGEDLAVSILGMPAESDWILSANYSDKSLMRNTFTYDLARKMGRYASRRKYVELILNSEYQGVYVVLEKIKRDANRVDISKLKTTDISGANLTGGYIIKIDKETGNDTEGFNSTYPPENVNNGQKIRYLYDYPDAADMVPVQKAYIRAYMDSFETAVHAANFASEEGYRKFSDVSTFVDFFIINEWSKNVDGYRLSTYLTKPKITQNGGKLQIGPVWDFDIAWRNADYCQAEIVSGWQYQIEIPCPGGYWQPPTWWKKFRTDLAFASQLKCRWLQVTNEIMPPLSRAAWVDSVRAQLNEAQQRNFAYWPILGQYVWPNPQPILPNYQTETIGFQNWLNQRASWITGNIGGICTTENEPLAEGEQQHIFPNPAEEEVEISGLKTESLTIRNVLGQTFSIAQKQNKRYDVSALKPGVYFILSGTGKPVSFLKK
jgi:subtilisin-like proprotein convertase family protein